MGTALIQRSFAAGELAPAYTARADLAKYHTGLKTCRNFTVRRQGGVANRSGTHYVATVKTGTVALYPFVAAALDESFVIEAGNEYFRFHRNGAPVLVSGVTAWSNVTAYVAGDLASRLGVNYYCILAHTNQQPPSALHWYALTGSIFEIPTPYAAGAFFDPARACFEQNGLLVTITHLNYAPRELAFTPGTPNDRWVLSTVVTGPWTTPPANPAGVAGAAGTRTFAYVVTAGRTETYEETNPSDAITIATAAAPTEDAPHELSWDAVTGAAEYYVYADPYGNGAYGFLGIAGTNAFQDVGLAPDFNTPPPLPRALFASANLYPAVNTTYQQRRIMAGTHTDRELVHASQVGFRSNFGIRSPLQDDDAITWSMASNRIQPVHHLIGLQLGLVVLTDCGEWVMKGDADGVLLPTAINPRQHGYVGANFVRPVVVGESVIFAQTLGTELRDLRFNEQVEGLSGRDLTIYSSHLFTKLQTIVDLAYARVPDSVIWCVRSDGVLCGLTYIRDEDVWGWHRHDTDPDVDGGFLRVCVIPENGEDMVYVVVEREVNGSTVQYIERFRSRAVTELKDFVFLDSSVTRSTGSSAAVSGLSHLVGRTVYALADGLVQGPFTVSAGGTITLTTPASTVQVGLRITAELELLDLDVPGSSLRDKRKLVKALALLVENSRRGWSAGPSAAQLQVQRAEPYESTTGLFTGRLELNVNGTFTDTGRVLIRHTDPTPLTVLGALPLLEVGG